MRIMKCTHPSSLAIRILLIRGDCGFVISGNSPRNGLVSWNLDVFEQIFPKVEDESPSKTKTE